MDDDQQFCLRWNNHQSTLISVFDTLLENGTLVDCTLAAEGKFLKAHKVVLSACSPYFAALLSQQYDKHPIFILKDVKFQELRAMMDYMYRGEVNISQDQLAALLKAAESLQIKGLSDSRGSGGSGGSSQKADTSTKAHASVPAAKQTTAGLTIEQKRPRIEKHPATLDMEPDVSDSREGSTSPNSRKRKKVRRRSIETNNIGDNHDQHSNSSSHSMPHAASSTHSTSMPTITSATSSASVLNVTKKTDHQSHESRGDIEREMDDNGDDGADGGESHQPVVSRMKQGGGAGDSDATGKEKMEHSTHSDMLIEPKNEYDESNEGNVEDLTLDDEELLDDLEQAGPSHGGEGSSQGYAQWQIERSQDEFVMSGQESAGQHRDAQGGNGLGGGGLTMIKLEPTSPTNTPPHYTSFNYNLNVTNPSVWTTRNNPPPPLWRTTYVRSGTKTGIKSIIIKRQPLCSPEEAKPSSTTTTLGASGDRAANQSAGDFNNSAIRVKKEEHFLSQDDILYIGGEKPWICRNCNRNYKWKNSLKCHLKNECGLPPKYFCNRMCGYKTNIHSNLKRHLNSKFCKNRDLIKPDIN
ncbi:longitudinals lacking protein, isoforms J/P/Q/S/Z-like isoform X5 [Phlebotomus argentipes]|uniref:longitudinals lacking protein, isoforms J/P/Q/S/Z-like isoform X5 n=1 Tax=Phlebotomus argentipes TaxID=94469 RepID=UPI0028933D2C|nr:longitudinals lacking protein, isoforms J/P/Q/S/Z-like isoform X5 [Phlebotomus argentipes]